MCGVIGCVGHRPATAKLLKSLEHLEYRGYDSAGIGLLTDGELTLVKSVGKIPELARKVAGRGAGATTGIGHTRWATHGRVSEENAHPLPAGDHDDVAIVLNGIIENHAELRGRLIADGERFLSQTDAEVAAHLVRRAYHGSLVSAVSEAAAALEGHFAFIAIHRDQPGLLVGTRRRCPLLAGLGEGETFLASSIGAFSDHTRRILFLEDDEVAAITAEGARIVTLDGDERVREPIVVPCDEAAAERRGHETFMHKEIHEQPEAVNATVVRNVRPGLVDAVAQLTLGAVGNRDLARFRRVVIVACGTAYHAGLVGRMAIEEWADLPCECDIASEWRYRCPRVDEHTLVIGISQSGETADTLGALRLARHLGARWPSRTRAARRSRARSTPCCTRTRASRSGSPRRRRSPPRSRSWPCWRSASRSCGAASTTARATR